MNRHDVSLIDHNIHIYIEEGPSKRRCRIDTSEKGQCRADKSLGLIVKEILPMFCNTDGTINFNDVATALCGSDSKRNHASSKRRIYDIIHALDGLGLATRLTKNVARWNDPSILPLYLQQADIPIPVNWLTSTSGIVINGHNRQFENKSRHQAIQQLYESENEIDRLTEIAEKELLTYQCSSHAKQYLYVRYPDLIEFMTHFGREAPDSIIFTVQAPMGTDVEIFDPIMERTNKTGLNYALRVNSRVQPEIRIVTNPELKLESDEPQHAVPAIRRFSSLANEESKTSVSVVKKEEIWASKKYICSQETSSKSSKNIQAKNRSLIEVNPVLGISKQPSETNDENDFFGATSLNRFESTCSNLSNISGISGLNEAYVELSHQYSLDRLLKTKIENNIVL